MAACLANRALCLAQNDADRPDRRQSRAIADRHGAIQELTPQFRSTLSNEWPDRDGSQLPPWVVGPLLNRDGTRHTSTQLLFESCQVHDLHFIKARQKKPSDDLSARERSVAELFCDGLTYKEIATRLLISPATVRAHLRGIYSKLGVSSKIELTTALS
jgi:DNA-binding CsgD family transcriptional regulator